MAKNRIAIAETPRPAPRAADKGLRVYEQLRKKAINYGIRPGERVNEVQLAQELNVSRTPVRAALNRLVSEGLLSIEPNRGFYRPPIDVETIRSVFEIRGAIEALTVRLFCERATDQDIRTIEENWRNFQGIRPSLTVDEIVLHDEAFHEALAAGSLNREAFRLLKDLNSRIRFLRIIALEREGFKSVTIVDHGQILHAIKSRSIEKAGELMSRHVSLMLNDVTEITREMVVRIYLGEEA
jgi:DNA-binding GntR family transcriptional regulator